MTEADGCSFAVVAVGHSFAVVVAVHTPAVVVAAHTPAAAVAAHTPAAGVADHNPAGGVADHNPAEAAVMDTLLAELHHTADHCWVVGARHRVPLDQMEEGVPHRGLLDQ